MKHEDAQVPPADAGRLETPVRRQRGEWAIYTRRFTDIEHGKFVRKSKLERVRVMTRSEGYAMVRYKGALPFVVSEKDLAPDA